MQRTPCPNQHIYGARCDLCNGSTIITSKPAPPPAPPDPDLFDFLMCSRLFDAQGILPVSGGWLDQSAWFCQAHQIYQGEYTHLRNQSDLYDAGVRAQERKAAARK